VRAGERANAQPGPISSEEGSPMNKPIQQTGAPAQPKPREPLHVILARIHANIEARKVVR